MPRLPDVPSDFAGATSDSIEDGAGVLFFTAYAGGIQRVYKVVNGVAVQVPLEHDATARGGVFSLQTWGSEPGLYITPWDDQATAHWRIKVPGFVLPPASAEGDLTADDRNTLNWVRQVRGALIQLGRLVFPT